MITIRFESGEQRRLKADSASLKEGMLDLYVSTKDRTKLQLSRSLHAKDIRWALLDNGTYVVGSMQARYD